MVPPEEIDADASEESPHQAPWQAVRFLVTNRGTVRRLALCGCETGMPTNSPLADAELGCAQTHPWWMRDWSCIIPATSSDGCSLTPERTLPSLTRNPPQNCAQTRSRRMRNCAQISTRIAHSFASAKSEFAHSFPSMTRFIPQSHETSWQALNHHKLSHASP